MLIRKEVGDSQIAQSKLRKIDTDTLVKHYKNLDFAKAEWLDDMVQVGIGVALEKSLRNLLGIASAKLTRCLHPNCAPI